MDKQNNHGNIWYQWKTRGTAVIDDSSDYVGDSDDFDDDDDGNSYDDNDDIQFKYNFVDILMNINRPNVIGSKNTVPSKSCGGYFYLLLLP